LSVALVLGEEIRGKVGKATVAHLRPPPLLRLVGIVVHAGEQVLERFILHKGRPISFIGHSSPLDAAAVHHSHVRVPAADFSL
jgi:hypothetical protein